jgi:hypothetical protein
VIFIKLFSVEYIDEIRKIDDVVANILSKLDVAAATSTAIAVADNDGNKLNQDNVTEVYRKLLFALTHSLEFVMQIGIYTHFTKNLIINTSRMEPIDTATKFENYKPGNDKIIT